MTQAEHSRLSRRQSWGQERGGWVQALILAEGSGNCTAVICRGHLGNGSHKGIIKGADFYLPGNGPKRWGLANIP